MKQIWIRNWILGNNTHRAIGELETGDLREYRLFPRINLAKLENIVKEIASNIGKSDTFQDAIPGRTELQILLLFLVTVRSYRSLQHLFRVSKTINYINIYARMSCTITCKILLRYV